MHSVRARRNRRAFNFPEPYRSCTNRPFARETMSDNTARLATPVEMNVRPSSQGPERRPAPHTAARGGRRRGGFQTRPCPHHQNSPTPCRPPPVSPAAHHRQSPPSNPQGGPTPHAASQGGSRRGGFQTRPCPHHQNSPRFSEVVPAGCHRPPTTGNPHRRTRKEARPLPHAASQGGSRRGGFQTRPCPHHRLEQPKAKSSVAGFTGRIQFNLGTGQSPPSLTRKETRR